MAYTEYPRDPRVRREAECLVADGYAVYVIALRPRSGAPTHGVDLAGLYELPLSLRRGNRIRYLYQYLMFLLLSTLLLFWINLRKPLDLVHVHSLPDFQVACSLPLRFRGKPVILDLHEAMPEIIAARFKLSDQSPLVKLARTAEQLSCRLAGHVIASNDAVRERVISRGCPAAHVSVIYNAWTPASGAADVEKLRTRLKLHDNRLLVHAGGINPERDLETLLRAFSRLPAESDLRLVIAGEGEPGYIRTLQELAGNLGVSDRVRFVGSLSLDSAQSLSSLSILGVVTLEDNPLTRIAMPTRVLEFVALRKTLVLPSLPYLQKVVGEAAYYYVPGDPESLALSIIDGLAHPVDAKQKAEKAALACSRFDWAINQPTFLSLCATMRAAHAR